MRAPRFMLLLVPLVVVPTLAGAQEEPPSRKNIRYKARTEIDFEDVDVRGELVRPSGVRTVEARRSQYQPLIRLRNSFDDKLKQSVEEAQ